MIIITIHLFLPFAQIRYSLCREPRAAPRWLGRLDQADPMDAVANWDWWRADGGWKAQSQSRSSDSQRGTAFCRAK